MLAMPLIGWGMLSAAGAPLPPLAGIQLPPLVVHDIVLYTRLRQLHTLVGEAFFALVTLHLLAGLMHGLLLKDGVFSAIGLGRKP
jgi:cytochrome b561